MEDKKYALFKIKTNTNKTVYLYCSDVENIEYVKSNEYVNGIFAHMNHKSISVIACDTKNVTNMYSIFSDCSSLKNLNLNNFNTTKVTGMVYMFLGCSSLEKLEIGEKFNMLKVTNKEDIFDNCDKLSNEIIDKI